MGGNGKKIFTIVLIIVIIVILSLGGYLLYKYISDENVKREAEEAVDEFEKIIVAAIDDQAENPDNSSQIGDEEDDEEDDDEPRSGSRGTGGTRVVTYKSFNVVGTIQIPRTGAKYPIVDDTSPQAMDNAIVFLYGPGLNSVGNNVIVGHNYRGGSFFGSNKYLEEGDEIYITDLTGEKVRYVIYSTYETWDDDFSYATRKTYGKREISLSTCTNNPDIRLVIWAVEE